MEITRSNAFDGSFSSLSESTAEIFEIKVNEDIETIKFKNIIKQEKNHELKRNVKIIREIDRRIVKLFNEMDDFNDDLSMHKNMESIKIIYESHKKYIMDNIKYKIENHYFNDMDLNLKNPSKSVFDESRYHKSCLNRESAPTSKIEIKKEIINCPESFTMSDFGKIEDRDLKFESTCNLFDIEATEILPNLFLGPADTKGSFDLVILLTSQENLKNGTYNEIFQFPENENGKIDFFTISSNQKDLQKAIHLMDVAQSEKQKILVCSKRGKDLSALVLCAFLMKKYDVNAEEAYRYLNYCRPYLTWDSILEDINPYKNFLEAFCKKSTRKNCTIS